MADEVVVLDEKSLDVNHNVFKNAEIDLKASPNEPTELSSSSTSSSPSSDGVQASVASPAKVLKSSEESESQETTNADFYLKSAEYWSTQPPTVNGMLGGYDYISQIDINQSKHFLRYFLEGKSLAHKLDNKLALDCGAGIGRVTKELLLECFDRVDMVDVTENFVTKAKTYLGDEKAQRVDNFFCSGLQCFNPEPSRYDCIWMQWVLGYLNDKDLVEFFKRCKKALKPNGMCFLKENFCRDKTAEFDEQDSSYTRPKEAYVNAIHKSGMHMVRDERQRNFPSELYEVRLIAFK